MRRQETAIELHPLDHFDSRLGLFAFLDRDHAVLADLQKRLGQHAADRRIVVAGDRGDLLNLFLVLFVDRGSHLQYGLADGVACLGDAAGECHWIGPGGDHLEAFAEDGFGQHGGGGGAVAGHVVSLARGLFDQLGAEIFKRVVQLNVLGHGDAVFGHLGRAPALVEHGVAAARPQRASNRLGQFRDASQQRLPGFVVKHHLLCHSELLDRLEARG